MIKLFVFALSLWNKTKTTNMKTVTLDLTKTNEINKAISLLKNGYKIHNVGLYLIVLSK